MSSNKNIFSIRGKKIHLTRVKHARTFRERFMGLMGVSSREHDYALVFHMNEESKIGASIHMLFMRMPIDVLWLNAKKQIVDRATLTPWMWNYTPHKPAKYVVELPAQTVQGRVSVGAIVSWGE